ncbi:MAG: hypothetical protein IPL18_13545 [Sphingomonadales bacterium]|nr:hypothetical protein [Sphingomonadales bacterium]
MTQSEEGLTYASQNRQRPRRGSDFTLDAAAQERQVRAFNPVPGAFFEFEGERYRVL